MEAGKDNAIKVLVKTESALTSSNTLVNYLVV